MEERTGTEGERVVRKEGKENEVEKNVMGWTLVTRNKRKKMVQIFVKVDGGKTSAMELEMSVKVDDIVKRIPIRDQDVHVTCGGRILRGSDKLESCEVRDGSTVEVTSRMRGGQHKNKKGKEETKQVVQRDDGMCAMACEQMRWITESVITLQSTEEEKRRLAEEVDKVRKMMAGMEKQMTGEDLQRLAEMEEGLKKFEEEVQAKGVDDQEMMTNFEDKGERKVTREGRGRAGLGQGRDETHRMNETCGKSKGKGSGGKGQHGGKGQGRQRRKRRTRRKGRDKGGKGGKGGHGGKGETREEKDFSRVKKSRRQTRRTSRSRWRLTWGPVAHTHRPCWIRRKKQ